MTNNIDIHELRMDELMERRLDQFDRITVECRNLFDRKNREYQDTISETGLLGSAVEIVGCAGRLKALVLRSKDHGRGAIEQLRKNILKDIVIYGIISLMHIEEDNFEGV